MSGWRKRQISDQDNCLDNLMYQSGLTASGCWEEIDSYGQDAIMQFAQLILNECLEICEKGTATQMTSSGAAQQIRQRFGL